MLVGAVHGYRLGQLKFLGLLELVAWTVYNVNNSPRTEFFATLNHKWPDLGRFPHPAANLQVSDSCFNCRNLPAFSIAIKCAYRSAPPYLANVSPSIALQLGDQFTNQPRYTIASRQPIIAFPVLPAGWRFLTSRIFDARQQRRFSSCK